MDSHLIVAVLGLIAGVMFGFMIGVTVGLRTAMRAVRQPPTPLPAVLFYFVAGVFFLGAIGTSLYSTYFLLRSQQTHATVLDVREQKDSEGNMSRRPIYRYTDSGGTEHRDTVSSSNNREFSVGDVIPVRYLRNSPAKSRVDYFSYHWLLPILFAGVSVVTAAIGAAHFWNYKRQRRYSPDEFSKPAFPHVA